MAKQESISNWFKEAKLRDQIEKEAKIEHWVHVHIYRHVSEGVRETLYTNDYPVKVYHDRSWAVNWRKAKFICQYPRDMVSLSVHPHTKVEGKKFEFKPLLDKYVSCKAMVTKYRRAIDDYVNRGKLNMFFDEHTDELLVKSRDRLEKYMARVDELEQEIKAKLQETKEKSSTE